MKPKIDFSPSVPALPASQEAPARTAASLRQRTAAAFRVSSAELAELFDALPAQAKKDAHHHLRVQQIAFEVQNEELRQTVSPAQAQKTLHALRVQLIGLEMQSKAFHRTQRDLDIESKRHELVLRDSELRFRQLFENNSSVMLLIDPMSGQILEANKSAITYYGYPPEKLIGMSINEINLFSPQRIAEEMQKAAREERNYFHFQHRLASGEVREVEVHSTPISVGDRLELMSIVHDISERTRAEFALKQSEQALRISKEQMEIAQSISSTGSWTYDLASNEIWGSAEGMRIFGLPPVAGNFPSERFHACIAEQDRERVHQSLLGLINEGHKYDLEFTVMPADGSPARITHSMAILEADVQCKPIKVLGFVQDISKTRMMEERVRQLAFLDPLTALPNRRLLLDRMSQALAANRRSKLFGALIYLDLDNFKPLNDQHGHGAGDMLLMEVALRLNSCVRAADTVSRIGGDEFVVLLGDLATEQAQAAEQAGNLAEKIRLALAEPYLLPGGAESETIEHRCSTSIGVVLIEPQHQCAEGLLKWADAAMYRAKEQGRDRVQFYEAPATSLST